MRRLFPNERTYAFVILAIAMFIWGVVGWDVGIPDGDRKDMDAGRFESMQGSVENPAPLLPI